LAWSSLSFRSSPSVLSTCGEVGGGQEGGEAEGRNEWRRLAPPGERFPRCAVRRLSRRCNGGYRPPSSSALAAPAGAMHAVQQGGRGAHAPAARRRRRAAPAPAPSAAAPPAAAPAAGAAMRRQARRRRRRRRCNTAAQGPAATGPPPRARCARPFLLFLRGGGGRAWAVCAAFIARSGCRGGICLFDVCGWWRGAAFLRINQRCWGLRRRRRRGLGPADGIVRDGAPGEARPGNKSRPLRVCGFLLLSLSARARSDRAETSRTQTGKLAAAAIRPSPPRWPHRPAACTRIAQQPG
jgi:hypothetical protein